MNRSLFQSKHGPLAILLVLAFAFASWNLESPWGRTPGTARSFLLASGWGTLACMVVVMGYVLRKYAHRGRYSPEFRRKVDYASLERADVRIRNLRQQIASGALSTRSQIQKAAEKILKDEGVHRVNRAIVEVDPPTGEPFVIRIVPTEPLGRVARWMHVHAAYGGAFGLVMVMHGGLVPASLFGKVLAGLGVLVFITGILGIILWALGPRWLTRRERDLSIEETTAFQASLVRKRDQALDALDASVQGPMRSLVGRSAPATDTVRKVLSQVAEKAPDQLNHLRDLAALIGQERVVATELRALRRVRNSFTAWRYVHVPAAILLTGLVVVHVFTIWKY